MKKIFTFCAAVLASVSMWAAYAPTADEVIILKDVYDATATEAGYSNHAAIAWGGTVSFSDKKAGDPNNNGEQTSSNVKTCSVKGNGGGKNITVSFEGCSQIIVYHEKQSSRYVELRAGSKTGDLLGKSAGNTYFTAVDLNANNSYSIFLHGVKDDGGDQDFYIYAVKLIKGETCEAPATPLVLTSDANETVYVGDEITLSTTGGIPGAGIGIAGTAAEPLAGLTGTTWTATAGEHTFVATQAAYNGYCAQESELVFNVLEKTPVASVAVDGPAAAYVGEAVTFTATAENASDYAWTVNGVDANTNAAEFTFTPAAAGEYSIVCSARNKFNATEEWIASEAKVLTASNVSGEIIKVELTSGTAATVTGALGGTADANLSSNKKMDKGKYFGFTLAKGAFAEGDTVVINLSAYGQNYPCLFADKNKETLLYLATETSTDLEYRIVLPAAADGLTSLYFARDADDATYKWNPTFTSVSVIRPMAVKSTSEAFKSVSFNGEALDANNFDANHAMTVEGSYVDAPVVVFTKTVTTIYEDDSQVVKDAEVKVTAEEVAGAWLAQAEINSVTYTINAAKAASVVVTYMDGETVLGTENVAINGNPAEYAQYQSKNLATFVGWYNNADLADEHAVADMSAEVITAATPYYAKFVNKYAESINIEKAVMENGKGYGIIAQLGTLGYASNITGSLDSLDVKDDGMRNYAYLGLKVKQNGALLNFRLAAGSTVTIKFGEIKKTPNVSINGGEYADMVITDKVYTHTAEADELISIKMMDGNAVVFQQIMIGEELQAPELFAINCAEVEHGTVAAPFKLGIPGETVELTFTPAEGYIVMSCTVNGSEIHQSAPGAAITFEMPAEDVNIVTTFSLPTAIDNAEAAVKAEKVIRDGQVLILRDGKIFNALGAEVK